MKEITTLKNHEYVFVGVNTEGRHGLGFAAFCKKQFGLQYGFHSGISGKCVAVRTKNLSKGRRSLNKNLFLEDLNKGISFAKNNPSFIIYMTYLGCGHGGYTYAEIKSLLKETEIYNILNIKWEYAEKLT